MLVHRKKQYSHFYQVHHHNHTKKKEYYFNVVFFCPQKFHKLLQFVRHQENMFHYHNDVMTYKEYLDHHMLNLVYHFHDGYPNQQ